MVNIIGSSPDISIEAGRKSAKNNRNSRWFINIDGIRFKIITSNKLKALGDFNAGKKIIRIRKGLPHDIFQSTVIHEIVEVINWNNGLELTHQQISTLAASLYQVLKFNKKLGGQCLP